MQDNGDLAHKIDIRNRAISALGYSPNLIIDFFAGEGVISYLFWQANAKKIICVENNAEKAKKIDIKNARVVVGDNKSFISLASDADIIDCDAYGLVMPFIELLPKNKFVIFTDGSLVKQNKVFKAVKEFYSKADELLKDFVIEKSITGNVFYGYGWTK
jgi:precorrin-6B methylase 2